MKIKVYSDINNSNLKTAWHSLENNLKIFPQSSYHWNRTWWNNIGSKNKKWHLNIITVSCNNKIVAILPMIREIFAGFNSLRSCPVHFCDFYYLIADKKYRQEINSALQEYLSRIKNWVRFEQVSQDTVLYNILKRSNFRYRLMTKCVHADLSGFTWDQFLTRLSRNFRQNIRKRIRKIEKTFKVTHKFITSPDEFRSSFEKMIQIHEKQWKDDSVPHKTHYEKQCLKEAFLEQFKKNQAIFFAIYLNNQLAACRLGLIHNNTYYDWFTSYNTDYANYRIGILSIAYMIISFINNPSYAISAFNFMGGFYKWKTDWITDIKKDAINNYIFYNTSSISSRILSFYYFIIRPYIKKLYHLFIKYHFARKLSRNIFAVQKKLRTRKTADESE